MTKFFSNRSIKFFLVLIILWGIFEIVTYARIEILWFEEVKQLQTLLTRWQSQILLAIFSGGISLVYLLGNVLLANQLKWHRGNFPEEKKIVTRAKDLRSRLAILLEETVELEKKNQVIKPQSPKIFLKYLLPIAIALIVPIALMVIHYTQVAIEIWQPDWNLPKIAPNQPSPFALWTIGEIALQIRENWVLLALLILVIFILVLKRQLALSAIAIFLSLVFSLVISGSWNIVLQFFYATKFENIDPQFFQDISFYVFKLPLWELIYFWIGGLCLYTLAACSLIYFLSANSFSEGIFPGFSRPQLRHLYALGGVAMLGLTMHHWLNRYELLYSKFGIIYGASYTDIKIKLPLENCLALVAICTSFWLFSKAIFGFKTKKINFKKVKKIPLAIVPLLIYSSLLILGTIASEIVQRFEVQPNELVKETPYIERSINMTRTAFNLNKIEVKTFDPQGQLNAEKIKRNILTIDNVRLWDIRPILQGNRQLQQIRLYYKFFDADIDRYFLKTTETNKTITDKQQVIIAARELDYDSVPNSAKTWVNEHLIYTHGYGFTLSPVNKTSEGGLPFYFVKDIGTGDKEGDLQTSSQLIRDNIPTDKPRIYYGELTNSYIMTSTKVKELDFPSGENNVYNVYDGSGGIKIGNYLNRILFAEYFKDWRMIFTQNFTEKTRLLFCRDINRRIRRIAPFLYFDRDPYLVVADNPEKNNHLYWIVDAYTTSERYPYSDPGENKFNYIRNSVKVVIDAYNGDVNFYITNITDPIIQTWQKIFPTLFKSMAEMPTSLLEHIRYPEDLFSTQSERLLTYHMTDAKVFYNREDQWQIPQEIYGKEAKSVEPYYLIMKLPTENVEEFILLHPYTPSRRDNTIAWLAARSDNNKYGKLLLYKFPKQKLIYGPNQIEALINQDPIISQQISLWNREGSRVVQGNLLIIPIEQSLLYVEPLYIEAEENSVPIIAKVIVVYQNKIIMADSLEQALNKIFPPTKISSEARS